MLRHTGAWCGAAVLAPLYWFARNWAVAGSPVPAIDLTVGPVGFASLPDHRRALLEDSSIVANLDLPGFWGNVARPVVEGVTGSTVATLVVLVAAAIVLVMVQRPLGVRHAVVASALGVAVTALAGVGAVAASILVVTERSGLHDDAAMPPVQATLWRTAGDTPGDRVALLADWVQYPARGARARQGGRLREGSPGARADRAPAGLHRGRPGAGRG